MQSKCKWCVCYTQDVTQLTVALKFSQYAGEGRRKCIMVKSWGFEVDVVLNPISTAYLVCEFRQVTHTL